MENFNEILELLKKHTGTCLITEKDREVSYPELVTHIRENLNILNQHQLHSANGQPCAVLDISMGWKCIPIILAFILNRITVVPVDCFHNPKQAEYIKKKFNGSLFIDTNTVDENGVLHKDAIDLKGTQFMYELSNIAFVLFTSGTTGVPKGVKLSYSNVLSNLKGILEYFTLGKYDRLFIIRPLTNASAITGELLPALINGSSIYLKPPNQSPLVSPVIMNQHSITVFCSTPSVVINLLPIMSRHKLNKLRLIVLSGECLNQAQLKIIKSHFPEVALWNAYGLTEASPRVSCTKHILDASCVGLPLSNLQVKIVNDKGKPCTDGELGELMVSGPNVMKGYFNDPIQTSNKMKDGWLYTSDKAMLKDGRLYVVGRKDEMIIRSGMNIFPNEIEGYLVNHPNVKEAIVFGKKDVKIGERIYAWIVLNNKQLKTKPSDLFQYFIDEGIDSLAWPNVIEIKEDLPKTLTGKVCRNWEETK